MPGKVDNTAPAAGLADGDASLSPRAPETHGTDASHDDVATPILAPASQLGPGFVATPEKPTAPDFESAAPQAPPLPSAAQHTGPTTDEPSTSAQDATSEHKSIPHTAAEESAMPAGVGSTAGPLAEAAAAHSQNSTAEEPGSITDASAQPKQPTAPMASQPEAEFVPAEGSLSSIHVHSAPSKALDAAERGESPAAPADGGAATAAFGKAVEADPAAAEKVHNILEDNVKAVEAANDSTADTLDAGLHMHGGAPADASDKIEVGKDVPALSHMTQPGGVSAGDAKASEPATESPGLLGVAGAGEQKAELGESAESEVAAANYHTQGTGQPAEDSAAEPAMAAPKLQSVGAAAGEQEATEAEEEPATESPELLGVDGAGEQKTQPGDSAESGVAAANYHTQGTGQPAEDSAAEPAMAAPELSGLAAAGEQGSQHTTAQDQQEPHSQLITPAQDVPAADRSAASKTDTDTTSKATETGAQTTGDAKAAEPAEGAVELLGVPKTTAADSEPSAGVQPAVGAGAAASAHSSSNGANEAQTVKEVTQAAADTPGDAKAAEPAEGSVELLGFAKTTDAASEPSKETHPAGGAAAAAPGNSSGGGATETEAVTELTQAAAETPGDAKAAEPAEGSIEFLGAAKATDAASEPVASPAPAATPSEGEEGCHCLQPGQQLLQCHSSPSMTPSTCLEGSWLDQTLRLLQHQRAQARLACDLCRRQDEDSACTGDIHRGSNSLARWRADGPSFRGSSAQ